MTKYVKECSSGFLNEFISPRREKCLHFLSLLNNALEADCLILASINAERKTANTCLVLQDGVLAENFSYSLAGTPCEDVFDDNACLLVDSVAERFPDDIMLTEMQVKSYMGFPIRCEDKTVALLVALSRRNADVFSRNQFVAEMFCSQLSARLTSEWSISKLNAYQILFDEVCAMSDIGAWEYDVVSGTLFWSDEVYRIYGLSPDTKLTPEFACSFYDDFDKERITNLFNASLNEGSEYIADFSFVDAYGIKKWVRTNGKVEKNSAGKPIRVYGAIEDVSDEHQRIATEISQREYLKGVLDNLNDAVVSIDATGRIVGINLRAEKMFGYTEQELAGKNVSVLMPEPYASQHDGYMRHYQQTGKAQIIGVGRQLPAKRRNGDIFQMELALTEYKYGSEMHFIGIVRDITERIEANDTIYKLAFIDETTSLRNKASFEREFKDLLARSAITENYIYIAYIDIDSLAKYNLVYGVDTANQLMALIAQRLEAAVGNYFQIFKYASDEFIVLSRMSAPSSLLDSLKYKELESELLNPSLYKVPEKEEQVTVSLASMVAKAKSLTLENLIDSLEYGMRRAKRYKPFGYFFLGPVAVEEYERAKKIKRYVHDALQLGEFHIVLQPQYKFQHQFFSSEALIRWTSKELGFISPAEFIPLAEESDDIILIGDWVIKTVCKLLGDLARQNIETRIAVNISSKQIVQPDFERKLKAVIKKYGVAPKALMLELTETTLVSDIELVKRKMQTLAKVGFCFSVDDFGTGYSSLSYIKELPISELKIDKYFVDGIGHKDGFAATNIVNVVIDMAKALNLEVVAEGVETQQQSDYLKQRGCDAIQGYLMSKPLSVEDWLAKLTNN